MKDILISVCVTEYKDMYTLLNDLYIIQLIQYEFTFNIDLIRHTIQ